MDREQVDFGWDLPPGVTLNDLDPPLSWDELYEEHITSEWAARTFSAIVDDTDSYEMVSRIVAWAIECGHEDAKEATEVELAVALVDLGRAEEALRRLLDINKAAYEFCKTYPEKYVPSQEEMERVEMADFLKVYDLGRSLVREKPEEAPEQEQLPSLLYPTRIGGRTVLIPVYGSDV